jgi:hypothetical protein
MVETVVADVGDELQADTHKPATVVKRNTARIPNDLPFIHGSLARLRRWLPWPLRGSDL